MKAQKNESAGKGIGYVLLIPAILAAGAAFILYTRTGVTQFNPALSVRALVCLGISAGLCFISLFITLKPVIYLAYLICLFGFFAYIQSQVTYIANVFVSIDNSTFTPGFIATAVLFMAAFILMLVSAILSEKNIQKTKEAADGAL